jgi:hypothetical protein
MAKMVKTKFRRMFKEWMSSSPAPIKPSLTYLFPGYQAMKKLKITSISNPLQAAPIRTVGKISSFKKI